MVSQQTSLTTLSVLGGVPLQASWSPAMCLCAYSSCWYTVQVVQSLGSVNTTVVQPIFNDNSTQFSTTSLPLVDAAVLVVQVQCMDAFSRATSWVSSQGTTVVVGSRALSIPPTVHSPAAGTRGFIDAFQPSSAPLRCLLTVWPPVVHNITVLVTKTYLPANATDGQQPSSHAWVRAQTQWAAGKPLLVSMR